MKILVISDTHRDLRNFYKVLEREKPIDLLIHCGDVQGDERRLEVAGCPVEVVAGNMDFYSGLPEEKIVTVGEYQIFLTHGHLYGARFGELELIQAAESEGADVVMFGHTHCPLLRMEDGITVLNPGSIAFPRQADRRPSYAVMTIDEEGKAHYEIEYV